MKITMIGRIENGDMRPIILTCVNYPFNQCPGSIGSLQDHDSRFFPVSPL